jgi:hypothetical protein
MKKPSNSRFAPPGFVRLTLNMPAPLRKRLGAYAAKHGKTVAGVIVEALKARGIK